QVGEERPHLPPRNRHRLAVVGPHGERPQHAESHHPTLRNARPPGDPFGRSFRAGPSRRAGRGYGGAAVPRADRIGRMQTSAWEKLVRDRIPELYAEGTYRVAEPGERVALLRAKLLEETEEYLA